MRRFDTPTGPPGWAGQGANLVRIVDPTGRAIAWLAPGYGGNCVGYAVRREGDIDGSGGSGGKATPGSEARQHFDGNA